MAASSGSNEPLPSVKEGKLICLMKVSNVEILNLNWLQQLEVINCFADFIVPQNKRNTLGFFCFAFDKKMPLGKSTFFAYVISRKRSNV